jgi:hypothetical protein
MAATSTGDTVTFAEQGNVRCHQARIRRGEADRLYVEPVPDLKHAFVREITSEQAKPIILRYEWLRTMGRSLACYGLFSGRDPKTVVAGRLVDENGRRIVLPARESLADLAPYAIVDGQELIGVACLGWPAGIESRYICGRDEDEDVTQREHVKQEYAKRTIAIERGTCVHWAHEHSASFLIPKVCQLAYDDPSCVACATARRAYTEARIAQRAGGVLMDNKALPDAKCPKHGFEIFYAYADVSAGEIGTVYQACNWHYIGQGVGRPTVGVGEDRKARPREMFVRPSDGKILTSRALRHAKLKKNDVLAAGWKWFKVPAKHKYVWFEGRHKKRLRKECRYPFKPYLKWHADYDSGIRAMEDLIGTPLDVEPETFDDTSRVDT